MPLPEHVIQSTLLTINHGQTISYSYHLTFRMVVFSANYLYTKFQPRPSASDEEEEHAINAARTK